MAVLCAQTNAVARNKTVARLVKELQGNDEQRKHLGLLVVGELGRQSDLSRVKDLQVRPLRCMVYRVYRALQLGGEGASPTTSAYVCIRFPLLSVS